MGALKNPRRHAHLADVIDYLRRCGAEDVRLDQNKRVRVSWRYDGRRMSIIMGTGSKRTADLVILGRQKVRQRLREAGVEMRA